MSALSLSVPCQIRGLLTKIYPNRASIQLGRLITSSHGSKSVVVPTVWCFSDSGFHPLFLLFGFVINRVCAFLPLQDSREEFFASCPVLYNPSKIAFLTHATCGSLSYMLIGRDGLYFASLNFVSSLIFLYLWYIQILPVFCNLIRIIYQ